MASNESVRLSVAIILGLLGAAVLWGISQLVVGVVCWFTFGKDEVPSAADFVASAAPWVVAVGGGIVCGRLVFAAWSDRAGGLGRTGAAQDPVASFSFPLLTALTSRLVGVAGWAGELNVRP
jgi:hypothetical protein